MYPWCHPLAFCQSGWASPCLKRKGKNANSNLRERLFNLLKEDSTELKNKTEEMTSLLLEDKEKTLLLEQKKNQEEELERLKKELEAERNKGFFSRLFKK